MTHIGHPFQNPPRGMIFDYGGTIDTHGCHWGKMMWHAYERVGVPVDEQQFREAYVHAERTLGRNPIIQSSYDFHKTLEVKLRIQLDYLADDIGGDFAAGCAEYDRLLLDDLYPRVTRMVEESKTVLDRLAQSYPLVLVSNFYGNIGVVLREFGLDGLFRHVVESAVVGVRKPDPRIFSLGVEALGLPASDVVVVGDSYEKDILPAHGAGCRTVWMKGEPWVSSPHDESLPDAVIDRFGDLAGLFTGEGQGAGTS